MQYIVDQISDRFCNINAIRAAVQELFDAAEYKDVVGYLLVASESLGQAEKVLLKQEARLLGIKGGV